MIQQSPVKLSAMTVLMIPTAPTSLTVEQDGITFNVMRVDPKQIDSWRGNYLVVESDLTTYYADSISGIREWVRLCCEVARDTRPKLTA